jgi:hypothetical protein
MYCPERVIEIPWALGKVGELPTTAHILEVGDVLGSTIARLGYFVDTIDLASPRPVTVPKWTYLQRDAREFESDETYDAVFSISTIEHVGIGHYDDPVDQTGDSTTLNRMARATRPGGRLYLTVPFGPVAKLTWQRIYDAQSIGRLLKDSWTIDQLEVFVFDRWRWRPAMSLRALENTTTRLGSLDTPGVTPGVALVSASKRDD